MYSIYKEHISSCVKSQYIFALISSLYLYLHEKNKEENNFRQFAVMLFSNYTALMVTNDAKENDKHLTSSGSYLTNCKAYLMWKKWGSSKGGEKSGYRGSWHCEVEPELSLIALLIFV